MRIRDMTQRVKYLEKHFQRDVCKLAIEHGWLVHANSADRQNKFPGFPDLVLGHPQDVRLVFAELKSETGTVKPAQKAWLDLLTQEPLPEAFAWWPKDWDEIKDTLLDFRGHAIRDLAL